MKYGKSRDGDRWHMLSGDDFKTLCADKQIVIVEVRDGHLIAHSDICRNCDGKLREAGARKAAAMKRSVRSKRDVYAPRHKLKD